ncbi:ZCHC3 protein, partial [Atractosteus spatula]|nr:ZCHC3 protein [Atractosteus spatula]
LTVQSFIPHVPEADIAIFDVEGEGMKLLDAEGILTGKRWYLVWLRPNALEDGGVVDPPGYFAIGPSRGFLFYPGKPMFCRKCSGQGHIASTCNVLYCKRYRMVGHEAGTCTCSLISDLCGAVGHDYKRKLPKENMQF